MKSLEKWREQCYRKVPAHMYRELQAFREIHPYRSITHHGREWRYISGGDSKEAVLLLTGATGTAELNWNSILRHEKRYRVVSVSYPPVGSVNKAMEGIISVLDAEQIDRVHIIGGSLGAGLGHTLIRHYPDRVNKLVLISLGFFDDQLNKKNRTWARLFSILPWVVIRSAMIKSGGNIFSAIPDNEAAFQRAYFRDLITNDMDKSTLVGHFRLVLDMARNANALHLDKRVDGTGRVLIIQADDDETFNREQRQALIRTYPGAATHLFETGGHLLDLSHGREIAEMIDQFLTAPQELSKDK